MLGLAAVATVTLVIFDPQDFTDEAPTNVAAALHLALGVLLLWFGVRRWRTRPGPGELPTPPKWMSGLATRGTLQAVVAKYGVMTKFSKLLGTLGGIVNANPSPTATVASSSPLQDDGRPPYTTRHRLDGLAAIDGSVGRGRHLACSKYASERSFPYRIHRMNAPQRSVIRPLHK